MRHHRPMVYGRRGMGRRPFMRGPVMMHRPVMRRRFMRGPFMMRPLWGGLGLAPLLGAGAVGLGFLLLISALF